MADLIGRLVAKLDGLHFDQIVGIPRGGLIVAAALGYRLDVRDVGAYTVRYVRQVGAPPIVTRHTCEPLVRRHSRLLVVEDSSWTGTLLEHARMHLEAAGADVTTAALWVAKGRDYRPDVWVEEVDTLPSGASLLSKRNFGEEFHEAYFGTAEVRLSSYRPAGRLERAES